MRSNSWLRAFPFAVSAAVFALGGCSGDSRTAAKNDAADHAAPAETPAAESLGAAAPPAGSPGAETIDAQRAAYPLTVCPVSGKELGSMGEPYDFVYDGRLVRFCCGGCIGEFEASSAAYLAKIDAAAAARSAAGG